MLGTHLISAWMREIRSTCFERPGWLIHAKTPEGVVESGICGVFRPMMSVRSVGIGMRSGKSSRGGCEIPASCHAHGSRCQPSNGYGQSKSVAKVRASEGCHLQVALEGLDTAELLLHARFELHDVVHCAGQPIPPISPDISDISFGSFWKVVEGSIAAGCLPTGGGRYCG